MKTLEQAVFDLPPTEHLERVAALKLRRSRQRRSGRDAYIFPGAKTYAHREHASGDEGNLALLKRYPNPPIGVRSMPEWAAWLENPTDADAYIAAFCAANYLTHDERSIERSSRLRVVK